MVKVNSDILEEIPHILRVVNKINNQGGKTERAKILRVLKLKTSNGKTSKQLLQREKTVVMYLGS